MTPGKKLLELRKRKGYSQTDLVDRLNARYKNAGFSRGTIANYELDRHPPNIHKAKMLVRFFNITLDDLFFDNKTEFLKSIKPNKLAKVA